MNCYIVTMNQILKDMLHRKKVWEIIRISHTVSRTIKNTLDVFFTLEIGFFLVGLVVSVMDSFTELKTLFESSVFCLFLKFNWKKNLKCKSKQKNLNNSLPLFPLRTKIPAGLCVIPTNKITINLYSRDENLSPLSLTNVNFYHTIQPIKYASSDTHGRYASFLSTSPVGFRRCQIFSYQFSLNGKDVTFCHLY